MCLVEDETGDVPPIPWNTAAPRFTNYTDLAATDVLPITRITAAPCFPSYRELAATDVPPTNRELATPGVSTLPPR